MTNGNLALSWDVSFNYNYLKDITHLKQSQPWLILMGLKFYWALIVFKFKDFPLIFLDVSVE